MIESSQGSANFSFNYIQYCFVRAGGGGGGLKYTEHPLWIRHYFSKESILCTLVDISPEIISPLQLAIVVGFVVHIKCRLSGGQLWVTWQVPITRIRLSFH